MFCCANNSPKLVANSLASGSLPKRAPQNTQTEEGRGAETASGTGHAVCCLLAPTPFRTRASWYHFGAARGDAKRGGSSHHWEFHVTHGSCAGGGRRGDHRGGARLCLAREDGRQGGDPRRPAACAGRRGDDGRVAEVVGRTAAAGRRC